MFFPTRHYRSLGLFTALLALALSSLPARADEEGDKEQRLRIYMAPVPAEYCEDVYEGWPKRGMGEAYVMRTDNVYDYLNPAVDPFGKLVSDEGGVQFRLTNQFAAERWFQVQLGVGASPLLVENYEEADVVYVCSAVFNSNSWMDEDANVLMRRFVRDAGEFLPHLGQKPHVIVLPHVARDYYTALKADHVYLRNFSSFILEPYSVWDNYMVGWSPQRDEELNGHFLTIPYPGHLHVSVNPEELAAGEGPHDSTNSVQAAAALKRLLAMESFSWRSYFPWRRRLMDDCQARPGVCGHHEWISEANTTNFMESVTLTQQAWYCMQPTGDTPLRRAFYDCILWGSIPVVLHSQAFEVLPFGDVLDWRQLLVRLPSELLDSDDNLIDYLEARHSEPAAIERLHALARIRHIMQYSMAPDHSRVRFSSMYDMEVGDDAFTYSWKALMRKLCRLQQLPAERCGAAVKAAAVMPSGEAEQWAHTAALRRSEHRHAAL